MNIMRHNVIIILLTLSVVIVACDSKIPSASNAELSQNKKKTEHLYPGKPVAPIQMDYQFVNEAQVGATLSIELMFTPGVDADIISVNYTASPSLVIADNLAEFQFSNIPANQTVTQTIHVIPQNEGKHYVRLSVTIQSQQGRSGSRSFSIPVTVGNIPAKSSLPANTKIQEQPAGDQLLIKKGQETRSTE